MKIRRILLMLVIVSVFLCNENKSVLAMDTGFTTDNMELEDQKIFLSNINLSLITQEPPKNIITCFDVNDNGLIAVGTEDSAKKLVSIYTSDGIFKYGYVFDCEGSFGVEWDDNNIIIYFVRSGVAALFDEKGKNIDLKVIQDTIDNNSYWNHSVFSTQRTVNESQYTIKNNMGLFNIFSSSYSQLIRADTKGHINIIYDVSREYTVKFIMISIIVILFVVFVFSLLMLKFIKIKNDKVQ